MKKKVFLFSLCIIIIATFAFGSISVGAATTNKTGSFTLSKTDRTEKKFSTSVAVSSGKGTIVAQHWKGSTIPTYSDTAYSKISSSSGLTSTNTSLKIYVNNDSTPVVTGSDSTYTHLEAGYGKRVTRTWHQFKLTKSSTSVVYTVNGTQ